jgi:hypothetical protein
MASCCPGTWNACIYQGATVSKTIIWYSGNCCGQGTVGSGPQPVDLTGYTVEMQIRAWKSTTAELYYDASSDITLGGTAGTIALLIPSSVTETFTWYTGWYDLLLTDSSGNVTPLLSGQVNVTQAVSAVA